MVSIAQPRVTVTLPGVTGQAELRNLTQRPVLLLDASHRVVLALPGCDSRPPQYQGRVQTLGAVETGTAPIPITVELRGAVRGLPPRRPNVFLIVPRIVAEGAPDRDDLLYGDRPVRNGDGIIIGWRALSSAWKGAASQ